MKGRNKVVIKPCSVHHIYQNTRQGHLIFYSVTDCLVFFSIISFLARRYGVQIMGVCLMADHIHLLVWVRDPGQLVSFVRDYTSLFSKDYNVYYGRKGPLFNHYGCAPKMGHKRIRSAIAYLYNNPVENHLELKAEKYQWNFLAYAEDRNPFSEKLRIDAARWELRKALYEVKANCQRGLPLDYALIGRITENLSSRELRQFTDYVIRHYNPIGYNAVMKYYGSYEKMVSAINSNTGSEYDLQEDSFAKDHRIYRAMIHHLTRVKGWPSMKDVLILPEVDRRRIASMLIRELGAAEKEVAKLLWL
ncbi:MAG: transposase [Bacteroidales bacterium]|nr:transposase [Bacteroidales bacterium]